MAPRAPSRGTNPDDTVTQALDRRRGIATQADIRSGMEEIRRMGQTADVIEVINNPLDVNGNLAVRGNVAVNWDDDTGSFRIGPTYDNSDPLAVSDSSTFEFVYAGSAGADSYLKLTSVDGFSWVKLFVNGTITLRQAAISLEDILGDETIRLTGNGGDITTSGTIRVTADNTSALIVEKADGTNIFNVNTNGNIVSIQNGVDIRFYSDGGTTETLRIDAASGHIVGAGTAPSVAAGANAGAGASLGAVTGSDIGGRVTLTTGTGATAGALVVVTFATAYAASPASVNPSAMSSAAGGLDLYVSSLSASGFTISSKVAPASSTAMTFAWQVLG